MNTSDVLYRAADLIEERGWKRGEGWVIEGREGAALCLEGGIMAAQGLSFPRIADGGIAETSDVWRTLWSCPSYVAVAEYLDSDLTPDATSGRPTDPLFWWNDGQKSVETVIATLRAAAVIEAAKEQPPTPGLVPGGVLDTAGVKGA